MLPYLLAAVGGYLIGNSLKSEQYADGGKIKYPKYHGSPYDRGHADSYYGRPKDPHYYPEGTYEGEKVTILTEEELAAYNAGYDENTARKEFAKGGKVGEFESIMKDNVITEKQILLIKKRLNADKDDESVKAVVDYIWDEKPYLTPEQNQKGLEYLMNLWKSPTGKVRSTNPYGYREQEALETFESFQLSGYHDVSRYGQKPQFVPQYIVNGKETSFEYYVDGKINIVGERGMEVSSMMADGGETKAAKDFWDLGKPIKKVKWLSFASFENKLGYSSEEIVELTYKKWSELTKEVKKALVSVMPKFADGGITNVKQGDEVDLSTISQSLNSNLELDYNNNDLIELKSRLISGQQKGSYIRTSPDGGEIKFEDGTTFNVFKKDGKIDVLKTSKSKKSKSKRKVGGQSDEELYEALADMGYDFGEMGSEDFDEEGFSDAAMSLGYRFDKKKNLWYNK